MTWSEHFTKIVSLPAPGTAHVNRLFPIILIHQNHAIIQLIVVRSSIVQIVILLMCRRIIRYWVFGFQEGFSMQEIAEITVRKAN